MTTKFVKYLLKKKRAAIVFFFLADLLLALLPGINGDALGVDETFLRSVSITAVYGAVMVYLLPMLSFAFIHDRRQVDVQFSLPASRAQHLNARLAYMFLLTFGFFFVSNLVAYVAFGLQLMKFGQFLAIMGVAALSTAVMLLFNTLLYLTANNQADGVIMVIAYNLLPLFIHMALVCFLQKTWAGFERFYPGMALNTLAVRLSPVVMSGMSLAMAMDRATILDDVTLSSALIELAVLAPVLNAVLHYSFTRRKAERAGQLSDGWAAYKTVIALYLILCMVCWTSVQYSSILSRTATFTTYFLLVMLLLVYLIAAIVYRRKVEVRPKNLLFFAAVLGGSFVLIFAAMKTHCFGLADSYYPSGGEYLRYHYAGNLTVSDDDASGNAEGGEDSSIIPDGAEIEVNEISPGEINSNAERLTDIDVSFNLEFAIANQADYESIINMLEEKRKEAIKLYYDKAGVDNYQGISGMDSTLMLRSYDENHSAWTNPDVKSELNYYNYAPRLTLEELKQIDEVTPVTISFLMADGSTMELGDDGLVYTTEYVSFTLDEFLEWQAAQESAN